MKIDLALHSFCLLHHFRHQPGFDALAFIDMAEALGFTGVNLSLNDDNFRHLGGREGGAHGRRARAAEGLGDEP